MADEDPTAAEPDASAKVAATSMQAAEAPRGDEATAPEAELAEVRDKLLRALADMDNLRRRTEREIADARQYAIANFARDMLTVGDNLRRVIQAVPKDLGADGDQALAALIEGVEVTERGLQQAMAKFGVRRIEARGHKFDPSMHQAMFEVDIHDVPPGTVAEEIQAGYVIGQRVLRPTMVSVAKRAPVPAAADGPDDGDPSADEQVGSDGQG